MAQSEHQSTGLRASARAASRPVLVGLFCGLSSAGLLGLLLLRAGWSEAASLSLCLVAAFLTGAAAASVYALASFVRRPGSAGPAILGGSLFVLLTAGLLVSGIARLTLAGPDLYRTFLALSFPTLAALIWMARGPRERPRGAARRPSWLRLANLASGLQRRLQTLERKV